MRRLLIALWRLLAAYWRVDRIRVSPLEGETQKPLPDGMDRRPENEDLFLHGP